MNTILSKSGLLFCVLFSLLACSDGSDTRHEEEAENIGFEIIEIQSPNSIRAWVSPDITAEEFAALELPPGWRKNQPREGGPEVNGPDSGRFLRSPDGAEDGDFLSEELFGFNWLHAATIIEAARPLDEDGLLLGSTVRKYHELTYNAGSTLVLLISPQGRVYFRIGRDANRVSDEPSIPNLWRLMEYTTPETLVIELFEQNLVIRTDNQDSFQGPIAIPDLIAAGDVPDPGKLAPLELTKQLCEDPGNMELLLNSPIWGALTESSQLNDEQVERMVAAPAEGPFYMLNLIRYREQAQYRDGRETDLTGREANDLYAPVEFLAAIGAGPVFITAVDEQIEGDDFIWDDVAIVEYPCPIAFFAMISHPEFQARAVHKNAAVEKTIVAVTHIDPLPQETDYQYPPSPYPGTEEDPAFELIQVMDFHDIAQYEQGASEPRRSGAEAWEQYQASSNGAALDIGSRPTARFKVQGLIAGDDRSWDEVYIVNMPSRAAFQALMDDETRLAGLHHRNAALANNYSMITYPTLNNLPGGTGSESGELLPITESGVGSLCTSDDDCVGGGFCVSNGNSPGFCSRECGSGECGDPYLCCHSCSEQVASSLPFVGSACMVNDLVGQLTAAPVSCSCD